jgi:hypothetical protein
MAKSIPGRVFDENVIVPVKTILVVNEATGFLRIGMIGRCNRSRDFLLNIHFRLRELFFLNLRKTALCSDKSQSRGGGFGARGRAAALGETASHAGAQGPQPVRCRMRTSPVALIKADSTTMDRSRNAQHPFSVGWRELVFMSRSRLQKLDL